MTTNDKIDVKPAAAQLVIEKGGYRPTSSGPSKPPTKPQASGADAAKGARADASNGGATDSGSD